MYTYKFIVNPNSRSGLGQSIWKEVEAKLKLKDIPYEVFFTKYQHHSTKLVKTITEDGDEHCIVALGGDGTINEVINGITDFDKTILGYIPTGSSNDFGRSYSIPTAPLEALDLILSHQYVDKMDVGLLTYQGKKRHFAVSSGIGYDAAICHQAQISRMKIILNKLKLGRLIYLTAALDQLFSLRPGPVTITPEGQDPVSFKKVYFVAAMNHPFEGGGFKFCPEAKPNDDLLDVIVISDLSKLHALSLFPAAFNGKHTKSPGVHIYKCKSFHVTSDGRALPVHVDGEPVFLQRDVTFSISPQKLRVITTKAHEIST